MNKVRVLPIIMLCLALPMALFGLSACGESNTVAATVNGVEIMENEVTEQIESIRAQNESYADDAAWATALSQSDLTPETLRENTIDGLAQRIVLKQEAEAQGYTADIETIDADIENAKYIVGGDEETWAAALNQYGYKDEQAYRDQLILNDLRTQLMESLEIEATDDELKEFIAGSPEAVEGWSLADGYTEEKPEEEAAGDDATANEEVAEETTGEDTPAEATDDTTDEAAAEDTAAEETPATDDVASAETTDETATFTADDVDLDAIPEEILTEYKELWVTNNENTKFSEWLEELVEEADVVINDMPEGLSYNVDMSLAETTDDATDDTTGDEATDEPTTSPSSEEAIQQAIADGLVITDDVVGEGDVAADGDTVRVHYTGTLEDGTVFDSNVEGDEPFEFTLGASDVIKGWDAGVVGMQVGGKRTLVVPASLAYGDTEHGSIPAGSTLNFTVELVEVVHNH